MFGSILKAFAADGDLGRAIRNATHNMAPTVSKAMGSAIGGLVGNSDADKALYIAALGAAIDKANGSAFFNLETQINDLNVKLGNLRNSKSDLNKINELVQSNAKAAQELGDVLRKFNQMNQQIIQNLR